MYQGCHAPYDALISTFFTVYSPPPISCLVPRLTSSSSLPASMEKSTDETTLHTTSELTCIETEHHHTQPKCCRVASERKQLSNTSCTSFQSRQRSNCPKYSEHVSLQLSPSLMKQHTWHLLHRLHFTQFLVLGVFVVLCLSVPLIGAEQRVSLAVLYGLPDAVASVGHQFEYTIPSDAFSGDVQHYEVSMYVSTGCVGAGGRVGLCPFCLSSAFPII